MNINQRALEAIRGSEITGTNLANLFERMATGITTVGSPGGLLILSYIDPINMPKEGELVPTLTLALKPFTLRSPALGIGTLVTGGPENDPVGEKGELGSPGKSE